MPPGHNVEDGYYIGQSFFQIFQNPMSDFPEMEDGSQHREYGLNDHTHSLFPVVTDFHIGRIFLLEMKCCIGEDDRFSPEVSDQRLEGNITDIGCATPPTDHQSELVDHETELSAHNPSMAGFSLLSGPHRPSFFTDRLNELKAVSVGYCENSGSSRKTVHPIPMGFEKTEQTGTMRNLWEKLRQILADLSVKGPIAYFFQSKKNLGSDDFAGTKDRIADILLHLKVAASDRDYYPAINLF